MTAEGETPVDEGQRPEHNDQKMAPNESQPAATAAADAKEDVKAPLAEDGTKATFVSDETKVYVGGDGNRKELYPALTKAELMKYADDPKWVKVRWALFILFWIIWAAMLVAAVYFIWAAPKCPSPEPKEYWQKAPVYSVQVKSFKDSDSNGMGDIQGVKSKVDYLSSLGVGSVWLSPIYKSPMKDNGYDVSDYKEIDASFGTMKDFDDLVAELKNADIRVIMDFVPNHSSDQHEWFQKSVKKEEPYTNFYVWRDGDRNTPPNNWQSVFGGSAWTFNSERGQWYLHQFYKEQPDLNLREEKVIDELEDVLRFWMDKGVDGFRMDAVAHMIEDADFRDENVGADWESTGTDNHVHTYNHPENFDILRRFRKVLDAKTATDPANPRVMMTEGAWKVADLVKYYGEETNATTHSGDIAQMPMYFGLIEEFKTPEDFNPDKLNTTIDAYTDMLPSYAWPNFQWGNHDQPRVASRIGSDLVDAANMLYMLLPGTPITYYGEEIGMTSTNIGNPGDKRDPERTPMQWNAKPEAGFTDGPASWLEVNRNYKEVNVEVQEKAEASHLKNYRAVAKLRNQQSVLFGTFNTYANDTIFAFNRVRKGNPGYLYVVNLGEVTEENVDVSSLPNLPKEGTVEIRSVREDANAEVTDADDGDDPEAVAKAVAFNMITLKPKEAIIVNFVPKF